MRALAFSLNRRKALETAQKFVQKGAYEKALKEYLKHLKSDPEDTNARLKLGDLYMKRGEPAAAIEAYAAVAAQFSKGGFDAKAVAIFKQILKVDAQNLDAHVKLGEHFQRMGLVSDALRELNEAVRICQERGLKREAFDLLKRIAALDPANLPSRLRLADLLARENLLDEARAEYHSLLELVQGGPEPAHVVRVAEQLMRVFPEDERGVPAWVRAKLALGEGDAALRHLKKVLASASDNIPLREVLVEVYRARGDETLVRSTYREIAELHKRRGDPETARDILQRHVAVGTFENSEPLTSPSLILQEPASERTVSRSAGNERERGSARGAPAPTTPSLGELSFAEDTGALAPPSPGGSELPLELQDPLEPNARPAPPDRPAPAAARTDAKPRQPSPGVSAPKPSAPPAPPKRSGPAPPPAASPRPAAPAPALVRRTNTTPVGDSIREVLAEARVSLEFGDLDDARRRAEAALRLDARSAAARDLLEKVASAQKQAEAAGKSDPSLPDLEIVLEDDADQDDAFASVEPPDGLLSQPRMRSRKAEAAPATPEPEFDVDIDVDLDADLDLPVEADLSGSKAAAKPATEPDDFADELDLELEAAAAGEAAPGAPPPELELPEEDEAAIDESLEEELRALEEAAASLGSSAESAASRETLIDLESPPAGDRWFETSQSVSESLETADFYLEQDMLEEAERAYRGVLDRVPQHPGALARLGEIAAKRGESSERARALALPTAETLVPVSPEEEPVVNPELTQPEFTFEEPLVQAELTQPEIPVQVPAPQWTLDEPLMPEPFVPPPPPEPLSLDPLAEPDETPTTATPLLPRRATRSSTVENAFRLDDLLEDEPGSWDVGELLEEGRRSEPGAGAAPERLDASELFRELEAEGDAEEGDLDLAALLEDAGTACEPETFDQVLEAFKRGIQQQFSADDAPAHYDLAIAYKEMGLVAEAIEQLGIVERSVGLSIEGLSLLAACKLEADRPQEAAGHLSQALFMVDEDDEAVVALRFDLGEALLRAGKRGQALDNFRKAAAIDAGYRDVSARIAELVGRS